MNTQAIFYRRSNAIGNPILENRVFFYKREFYKFIGCRIFGHKLRPYGIYGSEPGGNIQPRKLWCLKCEKHF